MDQVAGGTSVALRCPTLYRPEKSARETSLAPPGAKLADVGAILPQTSILLTGTALRCASITCDLKSHT